VPLHPMYMVHEITIPDSTTSETARVQGSTVSVLLRLEGLAAAAVNKTAYGCRLHTVCILHRLWQC